MTARIGKAPPIQAADTEPAALRAPVRSSSRWQLVDIRRVDALAAGTLLLLAVVFTLAVVRPLHAFMRGDWPTQFFPVYSYLGERLRAFDIPGWNPHQFSGTPFVGDPQSGWGYLPAMIVYALLPPEPATLAYIGLHIAGAGLALYALARLLGSGVLGSLLGAVSYAFAWVAPATMHLVIWVPFSVWFVVSLLGVELAVRATAWPRRVWTWLLAGFAISQMLLAWFGQASYYGMLALGAWLVYRTLLPPHDIPSSGGRLRIPPSPSALGEGFGVREKRGEAQPTVRNRLAHLILTGIGVFGTAFGLSAAGVLPRLAAISRSNLAGGVYDVASAWEDAQTGFSPAGLLYELLGGYTGSLWWYAGAVAIALAVIAPAVAWRWRPMPYFVGLAAISLLLALADPTPLHAIAYTLPRFAAFHEHSPDRVLLLFVPAVALLAAATATNLPRWDRAPAVLAAVALLPAMLTLAFAASPAGGDAVLSPQVLVLIAAASALAAGIALANSAPVREFALLGLLLLAVWDAPGRMIARGLAEGSENYLERSLGGALDRDPDAFLYANGAAAFLAAQNAIAPNRYAGFDPALLPDPATIEVISPDLGYRMFNNTAASELLVFNWATWFGIDDVQGYNPVQIGRYVAYIDALNGHRQEYHERDVFPAGIDSPLLDLLNLRYLVLPANAPERDDLAFVLADFAPVYADEHVLIVENPESLPRAWLVHEARQVAPGEALPLLAEGAVDARQTALLEVAPPPLEATADPAAESAVYVAHEPDRIALEVSAAAPALLVLSEVWDPGWSATVNGVPAPLYVADHILRAVPVSAGEHAIELRYDPPFLRIGLAATLATAAILIAGGVWLAARRPRPPRA